MKKIISMLLYSFLNFGEEGKNPFDYDLQLSYLPGNEKHAMVCFHGYGDNYQVALRLKELHYIDATLVSFNFPEHDINYGKAYDPNKATFGTIHELLPALYAIKETADLGFESIDLYGFSAGGAAVMNAIGVLNTTLYEEPLGIIGIDRTKKEKILSLLQKGLVILDTPLKSVEEIIDFRGSTQELEILAKNYRESGFRPIDSLHRLKKLSLHILLHFQQEDEVLSNRDDSLYIETLKSHQPHGNVCVVIGNDGGHAKPHLSLWNFYKKNYKKEN